uniref:Proline-rich protein DC2.15 n=1 Tax=Anthurium amnicola TaxID=1678845 RepID=A0A1D1ZAJ9_9ARAE
MASKVCATTALLFSLNLLFFTLVSSTSVPCPSPPVKPKPKPKPSPKCGSCPPVKPSCPRDTLKLGACADVLNLLKLRLGVPPTSSCCSLLQGLADADAALCLCTTMKAGILGINLNIPADLTLLLNYCGKKVPDGFKCA